MDLIRINASVNNATNTFAIFGAPLEDYDSLVWTEKFQDHSEFELKTKHVNDFRLQLPVESFVTLLQSQEVMKVESHVFEEDDEGNETLTIKGRSLTSILTHRVIQLAAPSKTARLDGYPNAQKVVTFLVQYSTNKVYTASGEFSGAFDPNAVSSGFQITSNAPLSSAVESHTYWIPAGEVWSTVKPYLKDGGIGIAFRRPDNKEGYILSTSPIGETYSASISEARLDLRQPNDLSDDSQPGSVVFDADKGHFEKLSWVESVRNAKTIGYLNVPNTANMTSDAFNPAFPDANLRTGLGLQGYSHESSLPGNETEGTDAEIEAALVAQMKESMSLNHPRVTITSGETAQTVPYWYLRDYELGDVVGVYSSRFGLQKMRVTEFIRSWEDGKEKAYPTLEQVL